jgi:hypothetical protein
MAGEGEVGVVACGGEGVNILFAMVRNGCRWLGRENEWMYQRNHPSRYDAG